MPDPIGLSRADILPGSAPMPAGRACDEARSAAPRERVAACDVANRPASPFGEAMAEARQAVARSSARPAGAARDGTGRRAAGHDTASRPDDATRPGCSRCPVNEDDERAGTPDETGATGASNDGPALVASLHQGNAVAVLPATAIAAIPPKVDGADTPRTEDLVGAGCGEGGRAALPATAAPPASRLPDSVPVETAAPETASLPTAATAATTPSAPATDPAGVPPPTAAATNPASAPPSNATITDVAGPFRGFVAQSPARDAAAPSAGDGGTAAAAEVDTGGSIPTETAAASRTAAQGTQRDPGDESAVAGTAARRPDFAAHLARIDAPMRSSAGDPGASPVLPHFAAAPGATHPAPGGASPVFASVPTPLGHPGFADRFAGEIGALALRGVGQAEIVLNPRELGPVRIELSLNGESARIAFSAAQPETRHAIEQTLPVLKDLLANHGLTLSGTSVSDGRAGDGQKSGFASGQSRAQPDAGVPIDSDGGPHGGAAHRPPGRRGLIDLYA